MDEREREREREREEKVGKDMDKQPPQQYRQRGIDYLASSQLKLPPPPEPNRPSDAVGYIPTYPSSPLAPPHLFSPLPGLPSFPSLARPNVQPFPSLPH